MSGAVRFDYGGCQVLVTGGTSGIGAGIAAAYRAAGASVAITGTRASAAGYDADLAGYRYLQLDLERPAQVAEVTAALPALDMLVNNAGTAFPGGLDESDPDVFLRALDINLVSAYRLARACRPLLARSRMPGGAGVLGIASLTSLFGNPLVPGYGAAKAGLVQLTKSLAMGWARDGIRVNAVAAGLIETRLTAAHVGDADALAPWLARTPLGRVGVPDDIAGTALFLTSGAAAYVTGQCWVVDGGYSVFG
ncbi:SDR family NAD(P)-dependent oxidoreductase [Pseudoduganella namucuonensis]|uniref:NAD(P)-dependent dehydrogenase, short-chain alcohol dehydrogenase family n=1 Tax=Pseudoduganella namucuonensis TaxID=1035707 RepID=A0A1I7LS34_9BURK|nr:SDR family oxidoreductase [Pseudoduganella namucuonensis]SFV12495.1 NAD(P)-dependent dehydrogenase, short-chain alcohol dehydrogenase family [Pseudoduganella namucuonensis]